MTKTTEHESDEATIEPSARRAWSGLPYALRVARRSVITVVGATVLLLGIALLVLPGPAILVIPIGLSILAIEWAWARRWLRSVRERVQRFRGASEEPGAAPAERSERG